jgi:ParB family chromosome partitioning protein
MTKKAIKQAKSKTETATADIQMIPLCKLKKSPRNARKVPHPKADIEALAASIAANGMLQNPVVEPEAKDGKPTGFYLATIGEGRRQAQLLRVRKGEIAKNEPIRCTVDTTHNALEISLAENAVRSAMHPADQFDAFQKLHNEEGLSAEDIGARFGVTAAVVKQRLKLAALSPVLMQAYRAGALDLEQLTAFAITDDHAKQEAVFEALSEHADRDDILAALNEEHIAATDPRARFVGEEAYIASGGGILRDLFDEEGSGYFTDALLLERLAAEKLSSLADEVRAEGWKWVEVMPRLDHAFTAGMRRAYASPRALSQDEQAKLDALEAEFEAIAWEDDEDAEDKAARIEAEIEALKGEDAYASETLACAGAIVTLAHDGTPRIERGHVRPEDDTRRASTKVKSARGDGPAPLSEKLVAELTASRTLALREALGRTPEVALAALTHALAEATFFGHADRRSCLEIRTGRAFLGTHLPGFESLPEANTIEMRHAVWAGQLGDDPVQLWPVIVALTQADQLSLLAHCVSLTLDAVAKKGAPSEDTAQPLAAALSLDMAAHWQPTPENYLGRVSKARILEAVREGVSPEAADNLASLKKGALADAAAGRLKGRGWLPALLRLPGAPSAESRVAA